MKRQAHLSRFLSWVLRHRPDAIGLTLDPGGWAAIEDLQAASAVRGRVITRVQLDEVVAHDDKHRFAIHADGQRIRACQGHSIAVDLGYAPTLPPEVLYHGTTSSHRSSIRRQGLIKGRRHQVHLSGDEATARAVGQRHGPAVVLKVRAGEMARAGFTFYRSDNGVWLTEAVPYRYVVEPNPVESSRTTAPRDGD